MGILLSLYRLAAPFLNPRGRATEVAQAGLERPAGPVVWLHCPHPDDKAAIADLMTELSDQMPDLWFLITDLDAETTFASDNCFIQNVPAEDTAAVTKFLDHWRPDLMLWLGGNLRPILISEVSQSKRPLFLLDSGRTPDLYRTWKILPGLKRSSLRSFNKILTPDDLAASKLRNAGALQAQIETVGRLGSGPPVLPCNEAEKDTLALLFRARPVWLAAQINMAELQAVVTAHLQAMRRSHRFLLLLVPANEADGDAIASFLAKKGIPNAQRSKGDEPESETQIYIADTTGEMGLWYRLAPVAFIGGTLSGSPKKSPNPFDAAALGSAVLHGPRTRSHLDEYQKLGAAGAARQISDTQALTTELESLLAPDKAAEMAHAAWDISSASANVSDFVVSLLLQELETNGSAV